MNADLRAASAQEIGLEHPWLGLESFSRARCDFFFGRNRECAELIHRLRLHPLLVFYGRSGLGKTSLLNAKLIPDLEAAGQCPALFRISYRKGEDSPLEQLLIALGASKPIDVPDLRLPGDPASQLWLHLHSRRSVVRITHLILDQFEEIFSLGTARPGAEDELLRALAILIQGAIPPAVEALLDEGGTFLEHFHLDMPPVSVLLALRDDYVYALNRWKRQLPALGQNNFELKALSGRAAFDAVFKPGELRCHYHSEVREENLGDTGLPPIISEDTAKRIVQFIAKRDSNVPLEEIEAVPPILSLLCRELNARRFVPPAGTREAPAKQIKFRESEADIETIIATFYERSLAGRPEAVRIFIEEEMVSHYSGARVVQDEAGILRVFEDGCEIPGAARGHRAAGFGDASAARVCLRDLVDQRLMISLGGEKPAYELIHDILASVVEKSRTARGERLSKQAQLRTAIAWTVASSVIAAISLGLMSWALIEKARAEVETQKLLKFTRFMDVQVGDSFTKDVPVQVRERVSDFLDEFYRTQDEPKTFDDRLRLLRHQFRRALVHLDSAKRFQNYEHMSDIGRTMYTNDARLAAIAELGEVIHRAEALNAYDGEDRRITRDLILAHFELSRVFSQMKEPRNVDEHLGRALEILETTVRGSPLALAQMVDWMNLPNLYAALGDQEAGSGDKAGALAWYRKAADLEAELARRRPEDETVKREWRRLTDLLPATVP